MSTRENNDRLPEEIKNIPDNETNIDLLVDQLKRRAGVIPFVGAGLSKPFSFPLWKDFLIDQSKRAGIEERIQQHLDAGEYEEAAEALSIKLGPDFDKAINETFGLGKLAGKELRGAVSVLPQLAAGPVITTNFDRVLEKVFEQDGNRFEQVVWGAKTELVMKLLYEGRYFLLKFHGDAEDSTDRVLKKSEYQKHYGSEDASHVDFSKPLPRLLQGILAYRPLLFLGCSLKQDRTVEVLEQASHEFRYIKPYIIEQKPESSEKFDERFRFLSDHNICSIWYPKGRHDLIEPLLKYLAKESTFTVSQFYRALEDETLSMVRQSDPNEFTSALMSLVSQIEEGAPYDCAVLDLGDGKKWLTSRLFIFAIILERMFGLQCFVFLRTLDSGEKKFIGIASANEVRWMLACKYLWLEEAFARAYNSQMPNLKITSAHGALESGVAISIAQEYLRGVQKEDPPDKGEWITLKGQKSWEHAQWLNEDLIKEVLGASLQKDSWAPHDPPAERAKAVLSRKGRFVALLEKESYIMLVDRQAFLEREMARLEIMADNRGAERHDIPR